MSIWDYEDARPLLRIEYTMTLWADRPDYTATCTGLVTRDRGDAERRASDLSLDPCNSDIRIIEDADAWKYGRIRP